MTIHTCSLAQAVLLMSAVLFATGCGESTSPAPQPAGDKQVVGSGDRDGQKPHADHAAEHAGESEGHNHAGWWCAEHGVPEAVCSMCDAKVAAEFKQKGDWCDEHDRAKSQCFLCDPSLKERFAAQYRAKEGQEPPAIEEEHEEHEDHKKG